MATNVILRGMSMKPLGMMAKWSAFYPVSGAGLCCMRTAAAGWGGNDVGRSRLFSTTTPQNHPSMMNVMPTTSLSPSRCPPQYLNKPIMQQQSRGIATVGLWAARPYAAFDAARALLDPLSPGTTSRRSPASHHFVIQIGQVALTVPAVLGVGYLALQLGQKMSSGGAFQHNYFMLFLYLVMSFAPTPCFQNLFADLLFVATWLTVTYFAFSLLPELVLKDHVFTFYLLAFLLPIFPLAFSFMPIINTRGVMTPSEAFVETLIKQDVKYIFGIAGSAFMDALDLFPIAGIRYISVQHEQNAVHMADGYARISGRHGVCAAQNGPGITNFVTALQGCYWSHSPVVVITPDHSSMQTGTGGFQECNQLRIFESMVKYQGHVNNPKRVAEITARAFDVALNDKGPTQVNVPRDYWYGKYDFTIPDPIRIERGPGGPQSIERAKGLLMGAKNPVIMVGGGVASSKENIEAAVKFAEAVQCPVVTTYLHGDAFPQNHPLCAGILSYGGSLGAMKVAKDADVVLALGTRINPYMKNPQYGLDWWPKDAKLIQVDIDSRRLGLTSRVTVPVNGDVRLFMEELTRYFTSPEGKRAAGQLLDLKNINSRLSRARAYATEWETRLKALTDDMKLCQPGRVRPRQALAAVRRALPDDTMMSVDTGNLSALSSSYMPEFVTREPSLIGPGMWASCGPAFGEMIGAKLARPDRPAVAYHGDGSWMMNGINEIVTCIREEIPTTAIVFNNRQWGAEKSNQVNFFGDRYLGTNLDYHPDYAEVAKAFGAVGLRCTHADEVSDAVKAAVDAQMNDDGKTSIVEIVCTRELGDPFRRDAMALPTRYLDKYKSTNVDKYSPTGQPTDM
ncbi:hypothetical protein FOL46_005867 [Perkinsus olseni]|uniref:sulfoacetaldehyde acetyltransferase n=1 Tax=Perkinsus olseni TaxID=32597 RepID=A0A7J6LP40_PEROL|nr:hypothetical protein FOL46_005867 [Perkinsus olseni]